MKTAELIELAFDHHRAGDLGRAEALYREILAADACDLNALHLLGALMADRGHAQDAVVLLERAEAALRARGGAGAQHAALYYNLGRALAAVGRGANAIASYRSGLNLAPNRDFILRALGLALLDSDHPDAALDCFERLLAQIPADAEAWIMIGRIKQAARDIDSAELAYRRAISIEGGNVDALFRLGLLLHGERQKSEEALAIYEKIIAVAPDHVEVHAAIGHARRALMQVDRALESFGQYLKLSPNSAAAHFHLGSTLAKAGRNREAIPYLERAIRLDTRKLVTHLAEILRGMALQQLGRLADAVNAFRCALQHDQVATLTLGGRGASRKFSALVLLAPGLHNTPYEYLLEQQIYDANFVLLVSGFDYDAALLRGRGDVVINLVSDADQDAAMLPLAAALTERLGKPVINHPEKIARTDREETAKRLAAIPGCRVAAVRRGVAASLVSPGFPFLVRRPGSHNGDDFLKISSADDLGKLDPGAEYYIIEYLDYRSNDGYYRKYRFFFVGEEILPYHLAIGHDWKVHHVNTAMADHPWMRREEDSFLRAPETIFTPGHMATLRAIRAAIGLDFFGIDCALDRENTLVVFETNATMRVHDENHAFPYRTPYVRAIKDAFTAMVARLRTRL